MTIRITNIRKHDGTLSTQTHIEDDGNDTVTEVTNTVEGDVSGNWIQADSQARIKGQRNRAGQLACATHVATYTATTAATVVGLNQALKLGLGWRGILTGQAISAVTHYWADRRFTLAELCERLGKSDFYKLGAPRSGQDDNPSLGTGAYALDQSWHIGWLLIAALATAVVDA